MVCYCCSAKGFLTLLYIQAYAVNFGVSEICATHKMCYIRAIRALPAFVFLPYVCVLVPTHNTYVSLGCIASFCYYYSAKIVLQFLSVLYTYVQAYAVDFGVS